jgi:hypothetical protein
MRVATLGLVLVGLVADGCALHSGRTRAVHASGAAASTTTISGVWDGVVRETIAEGMSAGDSRLEKQEWHLDQVGRRISGYYVAALTFTSGDGRPYVCSRQATFSTAIRFDVSGVIKDGSIDLEEVTQQAAEGRCAAGQRPLARYRAEIHGDVLTLVADRQRQTLYRNRGKPQAPEILAEVTAAAATQEASLPTVREGPGAPADGRVGQAPADVSGVWIWEHRGAIATGDEKQEREEWHVDQDGARLSGYYDRVVREISTDGHAFRCSMDLEFEIATRYKFRGEVRGNQVLIYESSFEVLEPSACDNGQRRLDAYEGLASGDEVRLLWGVGGQVLRRPRPDVPTQRF